MRTRIFVVSLIVLSFQASASTLPWVATQVLTETVGLHFASVVAQAGASCSLDANSNVTWDCVTTDSNARTGQIDLSGLLNNVQLEIMVTGASNAQLSFVSTTDISGAQGGPITVNDGVPTVVTTDILGSTINLNIYGQISLLSNLSAGQSHTVNYNAIVNYQ